MKVYWVYSAGMANIVIKFDVQFLSPLMHVYIVCSPTTHACSHTAPTECYYSASIANIVVSLMFNFSIKQN